MHWYGGSNFEPAATTTTVIVVATRTIIATVAPIATYRIKDDRVTCNIGPTLKRAKFNPVDEVELIGVKAPSLPTSVIS
jgi:hypothetical protein